jgi:hypothetical protein
MRIAAYRLDARERLFAAFQGQEMRRSRLRKEEHQHQPKGKAERHQERLNPVRKWRYEIEPHKQRLIRLRVKQVQTLRSGPVSAYALENNVRIVSKMVVVMRGRGQMFSAVRRRSVSLKGRHVADVGQQTQPMGRLEAAELAWRD